MPLSNKSSSNPSAVSRATVAALVLAAAGFIDASYLTASHYLRIPLPCSIVNGCEAVTTSAYSTIFGVPIALFGAAYYLAMAVIAVYALDRKNTAVMRFVRFLSMIGFAISLVLVFLQLFVLHAICLYCMTSAILTTTIFIVSTLFFPMSAGEKSGGETALRS